MFRFRRHRCPHKEPEHLTVEGEFFKMEKIQYQPVEKVKPFKPHDNLVIEGKFEGKKTTTTEDFSTFERSKIVRHEDNLKITGGQFYSQTTSKSDYQRESEDEFSTVRRNTYTKDDEETTTIRRRTWTKEDFEENLKKIKEDEKSPKYKQIERPQQTRPTDNLYPEGDFEREAKPKFAPVERPKQVSFIKPGVRRNLHRIKRILYFLH